MTKLLFILLVPLLITILASVDEQRTISGLPKISAHRGASRLAPENTRASFVRAIQEGADFIEIDVRTTSDGQQVIVHDKSLKRTTGLNALVSETDYATIKTLSAGYWFGKDFSNEHVPTLEDVCLLVNSKNKSGAGNVKLYVDCKAIDPSKVIFFLKKYELLDSAVFYGDVETLSGIRKLFEPARLMPSFPGAKEVDEVIRKIRPYAFDVPYSHLDKQTVDFIQSKRVKVFSDLLGKDDNPDAYRNAVRYGIDLIQTDDVDAVRRIYQEFQPHNK